MIYNMGLDAIVYGGLRSKKAQTSLRIHAFVISLLVSYLD